jgi:hypothetical protein
MSSRQLVDGRIFDKRELRVYLGGEGKRPAARAAVESVSPSYATLHHQKQSLCLNTVIG